MGATASKTASKAATATTRRTYPSRTPPTSSNTSVPDPTWTSKAPNNIGTSSHTAPGGSPTSTSPRGDRARAAASEAFTSETSRRGPSPTQQTKRDTQSIDPQYDIPEHRPGPTVHSNASPSETRNEAIDLDARDPVFANRLSQLGPVTPFPQFSPSSTAASAIKASGHLSSRDGAPATPTSTGIYPHPSANPAVAILAARTRIADEADREKGMFGRKGFEGRSYLDVKTIRQVLQLRDEAGKGEEEIERELGLKKGSVRALGRVGVVEVA